MPAKRIAELALATAAALWLINPGIGRAADLKPEELIAKHLDSIGTAQVRASAKTRRVEGKVRYKILVGGSGGVEGRGTLVSEGREVNLLMKFANTQYSGEQFIYNGDKVKVAATMMERVRSRFGEFVHAQEFILQEGLLGGVLTTAWPLLDLDAHKPKLSYEGLKKIDGRDLHDIRYRPKKNFGLEIHLYFDPDNFHHVLTVYTLPMQLQMAQSVAWGGGAIETRDQKNDVAAVPQAENRCRMEERFSDFYTVDGLTLPGHYNIHFAEELKNGISSVSDWEFTASQITNNVSLDPGDFQMK